MSNLLNDSLAAPKSSLRTEMPQVAAWVDQLRVAFGRETINAAIRAGQRGEEGFYAVEAGQTIGTPFMSEHNVWSGEDRAARHFCAGCTGQCIATNQHCKSRDIVSNETPGINDRKSKIKL